MPTRLWPVPPDWHGPLASGGGRRVRRRGHGSTGPHQKPRGVPVAGRKATTMTLRKAIWPPVTSSAFGSLRAGNGRCDHGRQAMPSLPFPPVVTRKKPGQGEPIGPPASAAEVHERLAAALPQPRCELEHGDPWTLLVATILSAQSTDRTVNTVTPVLFAKWPTPEALATAPREDVEAVVHRTGFFRNKAKAIQGASLAIHTQHGGKVPPDMAALLQLPGVARKTANVVLGVAFRIPAGIVVDTHVMRTSQRLGLATASQADKVEAELCGRFPKEQWIDIGHRLLLLGRYVCAAKGPRCEDCPLFELCPSRTGQAVGSWQDRAAHFGAAVGAGAGPGKASA